MVSLWPANTAKPDKQMCRVKKKSWQKWNQRANII